ncbi:MAG: lysostaphin resistance A-like protein [Planctomycetota bacterium]|jgi:membrane protease YdiL (CAAX protease family)
MMCRLFNIIAEAPTDQTGNASAGPEGFGDPTSIILCTAGLCVLVIWLFWFEGFGALQKAPVRRHRGCFLFLPASLLFVWLFAMAAVQMGVTAIFDSHPQSFQESIIYPANAILDTVFITAMLIIAQRAFARRLRGFGLNLNNLKFDAPMAVIHLLAVFPLILAGLWAALALGRLLKGPGFNLEMHQSLALLTDGGIGLQILIAVFAVLIVPVFEELLFRGFLQTSLRSVSGKPWVAIVLTSLFFSVLHPPTHIPALFMLSCGLGYAYERSGSLFRPILMHVFFNGFSVAVTVLLAR